MNEYHSDSDFSDYEISEIFTITVLRRQKVIRARPNHLDTFDDTDFFNRFRMSKASVYSILQLIGPHIKHPTTWNSAISEENMLLMTLRLFATGGMLRTVGDLYGVSTSTVSKIVAKVSCHIALLRPQFITFPSTDDERRSASNGFWSIAKFPNVIAALDCTHVRIISPGGDTAELYRNRKGFFSINVQTMCDSSLKITNIVARWPGSAHDSNILKNSRIFARFECGEFNNSLIIADSGYSNCEFLLTPLLNPRTTQENLYNESIIRTRCCVERSYGVWKRRFPILSLGIRLDFKKTQSIIVATAVLHNICCLNNEYELPSLPNDVAELIESTLAVPHNRSQNNASSNNNNTRAHLINHYFRNLSENNH